MNKALIFQYLKISFLILITSLIWGCSIIGNNTSEIPELQEMEFTRAAYEPGTPIVLRATSNPKLDKDFFKNNTLSVQFSANNGEQTMDPVVPWPSLTDEEMVGAIEDGGSNKALLRIKEANKESARNEQGELVRSEEAINKFIEWLQNQEELSLIRISELTPWLTIQFINGPTVTTVRQTRNHENVELMEPNSIGSFTSVSSEPNQASDLAAVILPGSDISFQPGDTITAQFKQADGSTLTATTRIIE